jgi:hypothetical protein
MTKKDAQKGKKRGFYGRALDAAEKVALEEAIEIEGLDEEIALLRVKLRELIEKEPDRFELHLRAANTIARLVGIRYNISKEQKNSLKEAITRVLTELAIPLGVNILLK